jgi:hypothetical protein
MKTPINQLFQLICYPQQAKLHKQNVWTVVINTDVNYIKLWLTGLIYDYSLSWNFKMNNKLAYNTEIQLNFQVFLAST